jgi:hypothetical protein
LTLQLNPPRVQVRPYATTGAPRSYTVSPAHVGRTRLIAVIEKPVQSSWHTPAGAGLTPLRMSHRREGAGRLRLPVAE